MSTTPERRRDGPYALAKAALSGLVQVLRQELRPVAVGVTGVFPGRVAFR